MDRLQPFDFDKSSYERPAQKWICAHKLQGRACQTGPDKNGRCRAGAQCRPYKKGDRWQCTRSPLSGGPCAEGPFGDGGCSHSFEPCKPLLSARNKRAFWNRIGTLTALLSLAGLSLIPWRSALLSPGPLTHQHSTLAMQCTSCHADETESVAQWAMLAVHPATPGQANKACVHCHKSNAQADAPHGLPAQRLQELTRAAGGNAAAPAHAHAPVYCATCHQEHRGLEADLTKSNTVYCKQCHQSKVTSFAGDHPDIKSFAYARRTHMIFDHRRHFQEHFKDEKVAKNAPAGCPVCHRAQGNQATMYAFSYEKNCQSCHGKDVDASDFIDKGIVFFNLPGLDVNTLTKNNMAIGQWPDALEDEPLSPLLQFLLAREAKHKPLLQALAAGQIQLADLESANPEQLRQVQSLVWSLKQLLLDIRDGGSENFLQSIEAAGSVPLQDPEARRALSAFVPKLKLQRALDAWLPQLAQEVAQWRAGSPRETQAVESRGAPEVEPTPGEWFEKGISLSYRPSGHKDPLLRHWLTVSLQDAADTAPALSLRRQLASKDTPGQCSRCHSIDKTAGGKSLRVNWSAPRAKENVFTRFDHQPHLTALQKQECAFCHVLSDKTNYLDSFKRDDASEYNSNFNAMAKTTCMQCHRSAGVGDGCTRCHTYHSGVAP